MSASTFAGPTPTQLIRSKALHGFQSVRFGIGCQEHDEWSRVSKEEGELMMDWLQLIVRKALARPLQKQAVRREIPVSDLNTMPFFLPDEEFDAACRMAARSEMSLRHWLYSTFKEAVERGKA